MPSFVYIRLIGFTAGTLLQLFWMVVILGYRRQRNFERVFFLLSVALFFFYSGSLLALNAQIYYSDPPALLTAFAKTSLCAGLCFLPPLFIHLHLDYAETRGMLPGGRLNRTLLVAAYAPALYFVLRTYPLIVSSPGFDFLVPGNALGQSLPLGRGESDGVLVSQLAGRRFCDWCGASDSVARGRRWVTARAVQCREHCVGLAGHTAFGGPDISGPTIQFFADRAAKELDVCGFGDFFGFALSGFGSPGRHMAGPGNSAGSVGGGPA